ncbi:MAG: ABC transporter permease [Rubripirellula sp.]|nr:ABC transporter permease [Rubripirellula sp.]
MLSSLGMMEHGLLLGQALKWLPTWLTPLWIIGVGLGIGAIASTVIFGLLSLLSFVPGIGTLADSPKRGISASLILGGAISIGLCAVYVPQSKDYGETLFLPLFCIGMVLGFGMIYGAWHRTRSEWTQLLREGIVPYLLSIAGAFVLIAAIATPMVSNPMSFIESIPQVNLVGDGSVESVVTIPGNNETGTAPSFVPANINYNLRNAARLTIESNRTVFLADAADAATISGAPIRVNADEKLEFRVENRERPPVPGDPTMLHIQNQELDDAKVIFTFTYVPIIPQASSIVMLAILFFLTTTSLMVFRQATPRVWALALSTAKNEMAQPLYLLLLTIGLVGVLLFAIYPFNTLGDDIRLLKDSGVTLIMILCMLQAVWSAGTSVSDEIEGRTALTVLSKPVSRRSFVLGKYVGIMFSVLVLFLIIASVLLVVISYKPIYDARETSRGDTTWQESHEEVMTTVPVLGLYFMETMAVGAVAVALATRLPLLANFITCFVIYVIGNLTSPLVASTEGNNELVGFIGKLIAVVVPNLNIFNVQSAVDAGNQIPILYLAGAFNYLVCFTIAVWMLAMLLFEDRDLA